MFDTVWQVYSTAVFASVVSRFLMVSDGFSLLFLPNRWPFTQKSHQISICLVVSTLPLWKMMEFVSWEYEIPALEGHNPVMFQTTNLL